MTEQSFPTGAVFLSYASEDADAAARICEALRAAGVEVWFDRSELRGGDAWDSQIKKQIHDCALFLPIISANTNARIEGYFRGEWTLATRRLVNRAHNAAFLLPVVIDETREADASVPEEFLRAQWTRLPGGETPPAFVRRVRQLLGLDVVPVHAAQAAALEAMRPSSVGPSSIRRRDRSRVQSVGLTVLALMLVLGGGLFWYYQGSTDAPAAKAIPATVPTVVAVAPNDKSIAVLPFADMSAEKNQEYMADGIAEELLNLLAQAPDLKVIARTSSFVFKGENIDVAEIAKKLNVAHVLEGSVRTSGDKMRITAQLIRTADSTHLWSERYDRPIDDIFAVQDQIANAIVQALQIKLMGGTLSRREGGTENLEAYRLYLRALAAQGEQTRPSLDAADDYLIQAIKLDSNFGRAWSRMASIAWNKAYVGSLSTHEAYDRVQEYAERALQVSPNIAEAHAILQGLYVARDLNWDAAEREGRQALAIDPNDPMALTVAAGIANIFGKHDEAERLQKMAIARNPKDLDLLENLAITYYYRGQYADSERIERSILEQQPNRAWARASLSLTLLVQGKTDAALSMLEQESEAGAKIGYMPIILHAAGRQAEADEALKDQIEYWASEWPVCVAITFARRGDNKRALEWLERAYRQKDSSLMGIVNDPLWADTADDPRFQAFLRNRLKLPDEAIRRLAR